MTAQPVTNTDGSPGLEKRSSAGTGTALAILCVTYGAFYLGRVNIAAAVPGLKASVSDGGLGLDPQEVATILNGLKLAYGVGQFINGQLAERFSPRRLLMIGMLCSALLNLVFGVSAGFNFLVFVWALNGYCQALGWPPCVRVAARWFPFQRRGWAIGIIGIGYQVAAALTFAIAGLSVDWLGWRGAFFMPALLLAFMTLPMLLFLRESPNDDGSRPGSANAAHPVSQQGAWLDNLLLTLSNPRLWLLALTLGLLNACRFGFLDWGIAHLKEVQQTGVGEAALKNAVIPLGGALGAFMTGWATDRFFGSRRAPVMCFMLVLLGVLTLVYDAVARTSLVGTVLLLAAIGFAIFGPQVLLVGTAPADLARRGTAAAAAGFVDFMGYMGAAAGGWVTGWALQHHGWPVAVRLWACWAFLGAATAAFLWNATAKK